MNKYILILLLFCTNVLAFECPEFNNSMELDLYWEKQPQVFVAHVVSGKYNENSDIRYEYDLVIDHVLKGEVSKTLHVKGDWSLSLNMGGEYVFFTKNENISFCDLVLPFSYVWLERPDLPVKRKYVEKIVELSGYKP
ncbi:hypothetical protein [Saccharophagus degradans]|uniref:Uncharacterized protein n=1 Tax=Saccharophagus degradans TaxID=86304 RepID=A0AAW7X4H6_9GAMM|nr:hypothetical protein [Saccharophagus degradans]MDO6421546.1 hypothetical protein [Saccharophagus degradans]MDO6608508.1 hypothetical protein [Saccharophagus degradans]